MNKSDYTNKVKEILVDPEKFKIANIKAGKKIRHILNQEKKFKITLNDLREKGKISASDFAKLNQVGSRPGILYGLSKVHKSLVNGLPKMRAILSAIGTASYGVAKFLVPILAPITNGTFCITNSFDINQDASLFMGSLDVDALLTSIPLDETIKNGVESLYNHSSTVNKLSKKDVQDLFNLATKESLFRFDGVYYYQTDGVAMGPP